MNRKEKIALLKKVENGNFEALEDLKPSILFISKIGEMYKQFNLSGKPDIFYTQEEFEKFKADNKKKTILLFTDFKDNNHE
jgi:hypothetical protein